MVRFFLPKTRCFSGDLRSGNDIYIYIAIFLLIIVNIVFFGPVDNFRVLDHISSIIML